MEERERAIAELENTRSQTDTDAHALEPGRACPQWHANDMERRGDVGHEFESRFCTRQCVLLNVPSQYVLLSLLIVSACGNVLY